MRAAGRLVLATGNPGKVAELRSLLDRRFGHRFTVEPRPADLPETIEDGDTLEANARKKAMEVVARCGSAALADDTGLFVDALDGAPGVHTARFAGPDATAEDNIAKLLCALADLPPDERGAEFRTVIALVDPEGSETLAVGRVTGTISGERRGHNGFGYDPVFVPVEGDGRTFAEMSGDDKQELSHRARALEALLAQL